MSFSSIQKCAVALRYLGYGITFDASDKYLKVSERTAIDCVGFAHVYMRFFINNICVNQLHVILRDYIRLMKRDMDFWVCLTV